MFNISLSSLSSFFLTMQANPDALLLSVLPSSRIYFVYRAAYICLYNLIVSPSFLLSGFLITFVALGVK